MCSESLPSISSSVIDSAETLYSGKLLLRREISLDDRTFQNFLQKGLLKSQPAFIRKGFTLYCHRCGNSKKSLIGLIKCEICHKTHRYCRKCIEMGRVIECEPLYSWSGGGREWLPLREPCTWEGKLTIAQQKAAEAITRSISLSENELLIWAVCGAGKTEMLFPGITYALENGKRVCIATPRSDVVRELLPRIRDAFSDVKIDGLYGDSPDKQGAAQLIIATTHQLIRYRNTFDVLIIDEVDAFPYHNDPSLINVVSKAKKIKSTTIYLTATPRNEHRRKIKQKNLPHVFVPIRFHGYPLPVPIFKLSYSLQTDLKQAKIPIVLQTWMNNRRNPQRQLLIFVPTIKIAEYIGTKWISYFENMEIIDKGSQFQYVHAEDKYREEKIQAFRKGKIIVLVTTTILERGVTFPAIDVVILNAGHDVFDEAALVQIAGRAGRSHQDPDGEVICIHDGKTNAMVDAKVSIKKMNERGRLL